MPRNSAGVYSKPAGTTAAPNTTIESAKFNSVIDDIASDLNTVRPITVTGSGATIYRQTRAILYADLDHDADTPALVYGDSDKSYRGVYVKSGASGAGAWSQVVTYLPGYQDATAEATSVGGTANAITATISGYPDPDEARYLIIEPSSTNTSTTVTLALNGGGAVSVKSASGEALAAGDLVAGKGTLLYKIGSEWRQLVSSRATATFDHQGDYDNSATYTRGQVVTGSNGFWYVLTSPSATGDNPVSGGSGNWISVLELDTLNITGGAINGTNIGASTAGTGAFTSLATSSHGTFSGSGGFYSNHNALDGGRSDAIFHRLGDRVLVGAAVVDTGQLNRIDRQISSLTRSGTTATATTTDPHGFSNGDTITISQVDETEYNGNVTITVTGANTFTYTVSGSPTTPASPETDKIMKASTVPAGTQDPMETARWGTTRLAQMAVGATDGNIGILAYSFASTGAAGGDLGTIAFAAYAVNDTTDGDIVYAGYFEAIRKPGAGISQGIEVNSANEGSVVDMTPHNPSVAGASIGAWMASGGEQATKEYVLQDSTVGLAVVFNGAPWKRGIIVSHNAITSGGSALALSANAAHPIDWFAGTFGSASTKIGFIRCTATTATFAASISLTDDGCAIQDLAASNTFFLAAGSASTVNGVKVSAGTTGNGPLLEAIGSDTNINLHLAPKGTGLVKASKGFDITVATDDRSIVLHDGTYGIRTFHSASGSHLEGVDDTGASSYEPLFVGGSALALQSSGTTRILVNGTGLGFYGATPVAKPTVTGSKGANAALTSLMTALSSLGLCTDSTS